MTILLADSNAPKTSDKHGRGKKLSTLFDDLLSTCSKWWCFPSGVNCQALCFLLALGFHACVCYFFFMLTILDGQQLVPLILSMEFWVLLCSAILTALLVFIIMLTRYCLLFWSICGLVIEHESLELLTIKEKAYYIWSNWRYETGLILLIFFPLIYIWVKIGYSVFKICSYLNVINLCKARQITFSAFSMTLNLVVCVCVCTMTSV